MHLEKNEVIMNLSSSYDFNAPPNSGLANNIGGQPIVGENIGSNKSAVVSFNSSSRGGISLISQAWEKGFILVNY
jgi:hypothetical protein